jgi:hypothetical protein
VEVVLQVKAVAALVTEEVPVLQTLKVRGKVLGPAFTSLESRPMIPQVI